MGTPPLPRPAEDRAKRVTGTALTSAQANDALRQMIANLHAMEDSRNEWKARSAALLSRVETLEGALSAIEFNAESWHAGEDGKARALRVIAGWARRPETVPEDVAGYARAGSPRGEEGGSASAEVPMASSSSPDGVPPLRSKDVRIDTYSNIAGSRVRVTHMPTGLIADCGEHKSELCNREQALNELAAMVEAASGRSEHPSLRALNAPGDDPSEWFVVDRGTGNVIAICGSHEEAVATTADLEGCDLHGPDGAFRETQP